MNPKTAKTENETVENILLRECIFFYSLKIASVIFISLLVLLLFRTPILFVPLARDRLLDIYLANTFVMLIIFLFEIFFILAISVIWVNQFYEIMPGKIVHRRGVFKKQKTVYECAHVQRIELKQGFIGKLLNFGTLILYSPALDKEVYLVNIDSPEKYLNIIQKIFTPPQKVKVKKNETIFFRPGPDEQI